MALLVSIVLLSFFALNEKLASASSGPCATDDYDCLSSVLNDMYAKTIAGSSDLGIESSDPLIVKLIKLDSPILQFEKKNRTYTGLTNCTLSGVKLSTDLKVINFILNCDGVRGAGECILSGYILYEPISGDGNCNLTFGEQKVHLYGLLDTVTGSDGVKHLQIGNYSTYVETLSQVKYYLDGYYSGNQTLLTQAEEFADTNWKEFTSFENQNTIWDPILAVVMPRFNKQLMSVAYSDIIST